jgi:hypothetical protein
MENPGRTGVRIVAKYSFNDGEPAVGAKYPHLLGEVEEIIQAVNALGLKTKRSREKTMRGKMLYSPVRLNAAFKAQFQKRGWLPVRVKCEYPDRFYLANYTPPPVAGAPFREMDYVKDKLGIEVQFGKYAFMVYNVCAKMTIFSKLGHIDAGIEIVPVKEFADQMSTGVSYFEQFIWDLEKRGVADIDIPVLILGIDAGAIPPRTSKEG